MQSTAKTPQQYLSAQPAERRAALVAVRDVILENLPQGYEEMIDYGMISYAIPLSRFPDTYNGHPLSIAALAVQKGYNSLYLMGVYGDSSTRKWFEDAWKKSGKKLDMGKSCVRFKAVDDLALDVIAEAIARVTPDEYIAHYERVRGKGAKKASRKNASRKKASRKKASRKKASRKKASSRKTKTSATGEIARAKSAKKKKVARR